MKHKSIRLLAALLMLTITLTRFPTPAKAAQTAFSAEQTLLHLLNEDRARHGLPPLVLDPDLSRIAHIKSQDMVDNNYFAHTSPTYGNVRSMLNSFGIEYLSAGENIARSRSVYHSNAAFLSSEGHRRNMLSTTYTHIGIGIVVNDHGFVTVTEIFVRR